MTWETASDGPCVLCGICHILRKIDNYADYAVCADYALCAEYAESEVMRMGS